MIAKLLDLDEEFVRCTRCGACQAVCPVFRELQLESVVARGKVQLVKAAAYGQLDMTKAFAHRMSLCIMCETCSENCPSGVRVERLIQAARSHLLRRGKMPSAKAIVYNSFLANRRALDLLARSFLRLQRLLFKVDQNAGVMIPRTGVGLSRRRILKPVAPRSFRSLCPAVIPADHPRARVAFFTGCMVNYLYPEIGISIVRVLREAGLEVVIPPFQQCCGTPMRVEGEEEPALKVIKQNLVAFSAIDADYVVTGCASCGNALKHHFAELTRGQPHFHEMALALAARAIDFTELCLRLDIPNWPSLHGTPIESRITYHDPCHLAWGQGVRMQPRAILKRLAGTNYVEMEGADRCCGSGGAFSFRHYELSTKIAARKVDAIRETGAEVCVTSCPACQMHLTDVLRKVGASVQVRHVAQLLDSAFLPNDSRSRIVCERSRPIDRTATGSPDSSSIRRR